MVIDESDDELKGRNRTATSSEGGQSSPLLNGKIIKYLIYQLSSNNITFEARTKKQRVSLFESDEEEMISTKAKRLSRFKKPKKGMSSTSI